MIPYYEHAGITIYHGDNRPILSQMADASVDLVFADPPYGEDKAAWDSAFPVDWLDDAARVARQALAITPGVSNLLSLPREIGPMRYRWTLSVRILNGMTRGPLGFGNWIACVVYARDGVKLHGPYQDAGEISIDMSKPKHPSPKPYRAMTWFLSRLPGTSVLDPFMGSGTTLAAAKHLGWEQAIGIEESAKYCDVAIQRLQQDVLPLEGAA